MAQPPKTYMVECYLPGVDDAAVERAVDTTAREVRRLGGAAADVEYLGALLIAIDEVVLHAFRSADPELVHRVSLAAHLPFERIVESVEVLPGTLVQPAAHRAIDADAQFPALLQPKELPL